MKVTETDGATEAATADAGDPAASLDLAAELALSRARVGELESTEDVLRARLAAAEAAASELRAANEALAREHAAVKKEHGVCLFFERRRDFGAELPAGVLLNILDHAPDSKCVGFPIINRMLLVIYILLFFGDHI